ncbi:MAG: chemotaxis protein, partial [Campylobacterales bacterium]|nr:chemotaxis protein [Campylobacterales bacterium]
EEVKSLASRSATAAKETESIIAQSIEQIKEGTIVANDTNKAFELIVDKIKKTSDIIGEIAVSIKEQSEGMNQVASSMGVIDQVAQQNAAVSEQAAAAAEELNAQAMSMVEIIKDVANMVGYNMDNISFDNKPNKIVHEVKKIDRVTKKSSIPQKKMQKKR